MHILMTVSGLKQTTGERGWIRNMGTDSTYYRLYDLGVLDCSITSKRMDIAAKHNTRVGDKSVPLDYEYMLAGCCVRKLAELVELAWVKGKGKRLYRYKVIEVSAVKSEFESIRYSCPTAYQYVMWFVERWDTWEVDIKTEKFYPYINKENPDSNTLVSLYFTELMKNQYFVADVLQSEYGWIDKAIIDGILWKIKGAYTDLKISKLQTPIKWGKKPLSPEVRRIFAERINIYWPLFKDNAKRVKKQEIIRDFSIDAEEIKPYTSPTGNHASLKMKVQEAFDLAAKASEYKASDYVLYVNLEALKKALVYLDKLIEELNYAEAYKVLQKLNSMYLSHEVEVKLRELKDLI